MNIHGGYNVLVENSEIQYSGDDAYAAWSVGSSQNNITFQNNRAIHREGGSGCFASYGGQSTRFINNSGTGCYDDAVVIFGNKRFGCFGGRWNASSSAYVVGSRGMSKPCYFNEWAGNQFGYNCTKSAHRCYPGHVVCDR